MAAENKLLFMDIDGCLNRWTSRPSPLLVEPECMANLNAILDATGAKVVVTSTLRGMVHSGDMTVHGLGYLLRSHGMRGEVVGVTEPDIDPGHGDPRSRGWQIVTYLLHRIKPDRYVVIDDEDNGISARRFKFVKVNGSIGLTAADADSAIKYLTGASP